MAHYTKLNKSEMSAALREYGITDFRTTHLSGGMANTSYVVWTRDAAYVLTVLDNHHAKSADQLGRLLITLQDNGIQTQSVVRTLKAEVISVSDKRLFILKSYIKGYSPDPLPEEYLNQVGSYLAQIHKIPVPSWLPLRGRRLPTDWRTRIESFADRKFADWLVKKIELTAPLEEFDGPSGLIHGDVFADNIVVDEANRLSIIDWETACHDLFVLDVGMTLVGLCRIEGSFSPKRANLILNSYQVHRCMVENEKASLEMAVIYNSVIIAYHRYLRHHVTYPDRAKQHLYLEFPGFVKTVEERWRQLIAMSNL